jgi:outer membrane protein assembly factor BamB
LVYAPDFGGSLWAVDAVTGKVIWKNAISSYTGVAGDVSRTTPAYWRGALIMGEGAQTVSTLEGAIVFALEAKSGRPIWRAKVEADPVAMITSAPIVDSGVVYVGTALSRELILPMNCRSRLAELCRGRCSPGRESLLSKDAKRGSRYEVALDVERIVDGGMNGQEALG